MTPISLDNFSIRLGERVLLKNCSFSLESHASAVIMGPTGTGKSVFLKSIAGILSTKIFTFEGAMKVNGIPAYFNHKLGRRPDRKSVV
mgnify:CR=1 FL=1